MRGKDLNDLELLVAAAAPELSGECVAAIARRLQQDLGGGRVYFKKAPAAGKAVRLGHAIAAGVPLAQAFAEVDISRATGFRLLKRRWR